MNNSKASDASGNRAVPDVGCQPIGEDLRPDKTASGRGEHALSNSTGQIYPLRSMCQKPISDQIQTTSQLSQMVQHHHCLKQCNRL